jgi:DNA-binding XRE family transcriptional regulator
VQDVLKMMQISWLGFIHQILYGLIAYFVDHALKKLFKKYQQKKKRSGRFMIIRNEDKIQEINSVIPSYLNQFGISDEQNEKVFRKVYGCQLKKLRLIRGYTQTKVAKAISVTFQQVQKYEKGSNACPKYNEMKLCEFLDCDSDYFTKPITENNYKFLQKRERNGYADSNGTWT